MYPHSQRSRRRFRNRVGATLFFWSFGHKFQVDNFELGGRSVALLKERRHKKIRIGWDGDSFRGQCQPSVRHFKIKRAMRGIGFRQIYAPSGEPDIISWTGHSVLVTPVRP